MKNTYWYRYFLVCNQMANKIMNMQPQNFALLISEEENGRFMNSQMTRFFHSINESLSELMANDDTLMFEELDMDELADLSVEQIEEDFENYCQGKLKIKFDGEE